MRPPYSSRLGLPYRAAQLGTNHRLQTGRRQVQDAGAPGRFLLRPLPLAVEGPALSSLHVVVPRGHTPASHLHLGCLTVSARSDCVDEMPLDTSHLRWLRAGSSCGLREPNPSAQWSSGVGCRRGV